MNKQLELLVELQGLDSRIIEDTRLINTIPHKISSSEKLYKEAENRLLAERTKYDALEKKKKAKEAEVKEIKEKIDKLKARTSEIKTNKEYQAHLKEIEAKEKEIQAVEDEILAIMVEIDEVALAVKSAQKALEEEKTKLNRTKETLEAEAEAEKKELQELKLKRAQLAQGIEQDLYNLYMSLLERLGGLAVAQVKNEVCQGCNMNIPPQLFVEIKKGEEIFQCPQCKRILYYIPTPQS